VSLLLDALKQAERNKAQSAAEQAAGPGDPKIRLDSIDLELREPAAEKVEPYVVPGAATSRSTVARAMQQEPALRAGARQAAEQEAERQSAKQLFAAKQAVRKPALGGTWIAGIAVAALAVASGLVYFWTTKRAEPLATAALPASSPKVTPTPPQPSAQATQPAATMPAQQTEPAPPPLWPQATQPDSTPPTGTMPGEGAKPAAGEATIANAAPGTSDAPATTDTALGPTSPQSPAAPRSVEADTAPGEHGNGGAGGNTSATQVPPADTPDVAVADDNEREPVQLAAARPPKKGTRPSKRAAGKTRTSDSWAVQAEGVEQSGTAAPPSVPRNARSKDRNVGSAGESTLSVQRSAPAQELSPDLAAAYQALISGNAAVAAQRYRAVLNADAFNIDAELGLATIAAGQGDRDGARHHYRRALELDPKNDVALAGLASLAGASGASSESGLKTQLAEQPTSHHLHFALGNDFARQRRWSEAQQAYFNAFSLDPDNPDYAYNLAVSLDQLNQPRAALTYYERAKQLSQARTAQFSRAQLDQRVSELKQP
jgi:Flp pilus assembly protein TadD